MDVPAGRRVVGAPHRPCTPLRNVGYGLGLMDGDGGGWRSPAEAERGRTEETAGTRTGEAGGGRRSAPEFCPNFLEMQTQTNTVRQLWGWRREEVVAWEGEELRQGGKVTFDLGERERREKRRL